MPFSGKQVTQVGNRGGYSQALLLQGVVTFYIKNPIRFRIRLASDLARLFTLFSHWIHPGTLGGQWPGKIPLAF